MPRQLLRATLLAALLPVLVPQATSAQMKTIAPAVHSTKPARTGLAKLWPWSKPAAENTIVRVSVDGPKAMEVIPSNPKRPIVLESNADLQLLRSRQNLRKEVTPVAPVAPVIEEAPVTEVVPTFEAAPAFEAVPTFEAAPNLQQIDLQAFEDAAAEPAAVPAVEVPAEAEPAAVENEIPTLPAVSAEDTQAAPVYFGQVPATPVAAPQPAAAMVGQPIVPQPGYYRLDAPLYPSPQTNIPLEVGSTMITNPAFAPHEMTYPHKYRGLYGPFYHRTSRWWVMTPLGIYKSERRVLTGTEVRVKYKSHISPFSFFFPPVTH